MKRRNRFVARLLLPFLIAGVAGAQADSSTEQKPASVSGAVSNSVTGEPLAHARVILADAARVCTEIRRTCQYKITTADGRFSFGTVVAGKYEIFVEHRGYGPLEDGQDNRKPLELKSGEEIKDLALQLVPDAVIAGRVLDAKGTPVERVAVEVVGGGGSSYPAVTDDRGVFRIGRLRAGRYLVKTILLPSDLGPPEIRTDGSVAPYYGPTYYPSSPDAKSATPVTARAGEETGGIEIRLAPQPILHVSGTAPVGPQECDSLVRLYGGSSDQRPNRLERHYRLENDRTFIFWRVPPGRYQLFAESLPLGILRSTPIEVNVTNTSIEGIRLLCPGPLELAGHVEMDGGAHIPDQKGGTASLKLLPLGLNDYRELSAPFDPDGSFKLESVPPGRYHLIGEGLPQNFYLKSAHVGTTDLQDGILDLRNSDATSEMRVQVGANGAEISGVVRDTKGPATGAQVALLFDDEYGFDVAATTPAGVDGRFVLHGITPGKYKLVAVDQKNSAEYWSADGLALHAPVIEDIDVQESDKILRDLKLISPP